MERRVWAYTKAVRIAPNSTYYQDIDEDTFLAGYKTSNDGFGDIEFKEYEQMPGTKTIAVKNNHEEFPQLVVLIFRRLAV